MAAAGVALVARTEREAVMGFVELLPHLARLRGLLRRLARMAMAADLVIAVDHSGFNLRLLGEVERLPPGARPRTLCYIPPKLWAWGGRRAAELARCADRVACALPFEEGFLRARGIRARYVGHPLLDEMAAAGAASSGVRPLLALLPGSRESEVRRLFGSFLGAAAELRRRRPGLRVAVGMSPALPRSLYDDCWRSWSARRGSGRLRPEFVLGSSSLLAEAGAAIAKSGTVTLECALAGLPYVTGYRAAGLSWRYIRSRLAVEHVALPNIILGREAVPELIQERCTAERLARALRPLLEAGPERDRQLAAFREVRARLEEPFAGRPGPGAGGDDTAVRTRSTVAVRVARMAAQLLEAA